MPTSPLIFIFFCSRKNKLHILVALDDEDEQGGKAEGELFWDDGDSIGNILQKSNKSSMYSSDA